MPAFYAHYRFGKSVLEKLGEPLRSVCIRCRGPFDIGLHGPDIFFFYHPFRSNPVSSIGHASHGLSGSDFFRQFSTAFDASGQKDALLAYFCGFLCHLALDSTCHPEVYRAQKYTGQSHAAIETAFDRTLLLRDGIEPTAYDPCRHFQITTEGASVISRIFPTVTERNIEKSLHSMVLCGRLLFIRTQRLRSMLNAFLRKLPHGNFVCDMMMTSAPNLYCTESDLRLTDCFEHAKSIALQLLSETALYIENKAPVSDIFNRTFKGPL